MPLIIDSGVKALLLSGSATIHTTLDITFGDDSEIHVSTVDIGSVSTNTYGTVNYVKNLRTSGSLEQSLTVSADKVDLEIQNIDLVLGGAIIDSRLKLNGARGILSHVFVDGGTKTQIEILHGQIANASSEDMNVKMQLISFLSLTGPVGGWRPLMKYCPWMFKKDGCNSTDPSSTCSHTFEGVNGCSTKAPAAALVNPVPTNNQDRHGGFIFKTSIVTGSVIKDPAGAMDGGNDFNTYIKNRGGWDGRHELPVEYYPFGN